jgi:hypothetical protein
MVMIRWHVAPSLAGPVLGVVATALLPKRDYDGVGAAFADAS